MTRPGLTALCLLGAAAAACGPDPTVFFVRVDARSSVGEVSALRVTARNQSSSASTDFDITGRQFPLSFTITPEGRQGELVIELEARDAGGLLRGVARITRPILPEQQVRIDALLDPADFVVNSSTAGTQKPSFRTGRNGRQIGVAPDGSFMITFIDDCSALGRCDVFARIFDADGAPLVNQATSTSDDFSVNLELLFCSEPAVAVGDGGRFVVWETVDDIRGVALSADGGHLTAADTVLSAADAEMLADPDVAALAGGEFVVVWSQARAGGGREIRARLVGGDGQPVTNPVTGDDRDFAVSVSPDLPVENPTVSATGVGRGFAVVWSDRANVRARFFNEAGLPAAAGESQITSLGPASEVAGPKVAADSAGNAAVVFSASAPERPELTAGGYVVGRFAPPAGAPRGDLVLLDSPTPSGATAPAVALGPGEVIGATWHNCGDRGDGSGCGVFLQLFSPDGAALGEPRLVNTTRLGDQTDPSIAGTPEGFVLVWSDASEEPPDTSGGSVRARLIYLD